MIQLSRRVRSMLSLGLNCLALCFSVSAFSTSYWCEGTHKVVKSPCLSVVKKGNCVPNNSNGTVDVNETVDPHKVQYIWETGEDKYAFQYFHTGFWLSCEEHHGETKSICQKLVKKPAGNCSHVTTGDCKEEKCRSFIELPPESEQGVLWLSVASEFLYIILLSIGFLLMCLDAIYYANFIDGLKINAFAAVITVLSGLLGMVAHMMYMTVFQVAVNLGPKDWRPQTWYYGWSFGLAWLSFTLCMSASVLTLNTYTKTILEFKYRRQIFEKYTASTGSIRGSNSPTLDPDLERFLWEKYIFSVSESLDFSGSPPGRLALSGGRKECSGGYSGLPRSHSGEAKDEDDGEPC